MIEALVMPRVYGSLPAAVIQCCFHISHLTAVFPGSFPHDPGPGCKPAKTPGDTPVEEMRALPVIREHSQKKHGMSQLIIIFILVAKDIQKFTICNNETVT
jgi:hypothetical protein